MEEMKNTELRIGNYINGIYETEIDRGNGIIEDVERSEVVKVAGLDGAGLSEYSIWIEDGYNKEYDSFEPIPLTEEWLLKFGFKKDTKGSVSIQFNYGVNPITKDYMMQLIWLKTIPDYELEECPFYKNGHFKIKHVHQLQNLYFSLTGEELKLKDK